MRRSIHILLISAVALLWSCAKFDVPDVAVDPSTDLTIVELLDDGNMLVRGSLNSGKMNDVSVSTRAVPHDERIETGVCMIFGEDPNLKGVSTNKYTTPDSPLLLMKELTINHEGTFFITLPRYADIAFLRIAVNLTKREKVIFDSTTAWGDSESSYEMVGDEKWLKVPGVGDVAGVSKFKEYTYQSVGLDGIYDIDYKVKPTGNIVKDPFSGIESLEYDGVNDIAPNPNTDALSLFPMSSVGFVMNDGINEASLKEMFGRTIYMVRTCSKVDVTVSDTTFTISKIYMIDCAQESRVRSTVLSESASVGSTVRDTVFKVPVDLGGTICYEPLECSIPKLGTTPPIYFYPNSGGAYKSNSGVVDQGVNPQYVIIKGRAAGYDADGYYKVALKARYPLSYKFADAEKTTLLEDADGNYVVESWSDVTYDILRNTDFNIDVKLVDKPGYKTLADAKSESNPASNISYDLVVEGANGRHEVLVSNGTYYVELATTRVYMAGYGGAANNSSIEFTVHPNKTKFPAVYIQSDYGVDVTSCLVGDSQMPLMEVDLTNSDVLEWLFNPSMLTYYDPEIAAAYDSPTEFYNAIFGNAGVVYKRWYKLQGDVVDTKVKVNFTATYSGRVRLQIGDMVKFIPVEYESDAFTGIEQAVTFEHNEDFSYEQGDISYLKADETIDATASCDWFSMGGRISENKTSARELRAMIFPKRADGITKLYIKQDKFVSQIGDPDAKDEGVLSDLRDGNVIYTGGVNGDKYKNAADAAAQIEAVLEKGYTTIHFDGGVNDKLKIADIMKEIEKTDLTFKVDLSSMTGFAEDYNGKKYGDMFQDNDNITSIILPSSVKKIEKKMFSNCANLKVVIIGTPADPSPNFDTFVTSAFDGCPKLETIIVYSKSGSVKVESQNTNLGYFNSSKTIDSDDATAIVKKTVNSNGTVISTSTKNTGCCYIFGNTNDYSTAGGAYKESLYTFEVVQ